MPEKKKLNVYQVTDRTGGEYTIPAEDFTHDYESLRFIRDGETVAAFNGWVSFYKRGER